MGRCRLAPVFGGVPNPTGRRGPGKNVKSATQVEWKISGRGKQGDSGELRSRLRVIFWFTCLPKAFHPFHRKKGGKKRKTEKKKKKKKPVNLCDRLDYKDRFVYFTP